MITKAEFEKAMEMDRQQTIKELMENCDLLLKGNRMLTENRLSESEYMVLEEGLWEKVKYGLAKLGRYKAGGKIFGKGKIDQEAGAKIQAILDKKGNEVIKALDTKIKEENPEFPNNEKGEQFLKTVMEIAAVYDSIVASTKKKPNEKGFLPADAANSVIADLAEYVQKFLDVDLAAAYTVMDSEEEKVDKENGNEELLTDEVEDINEDEAEDVRTQLQSKAGKKTYDTKRMGGEGLASNKLPLVLAGLGGALGALGWLAQTDFIKEIIIKIFGGDINVTDTEKITEIINGGNPDSEGFVHWASKLMGKDLKTGADISEFVNKFGAEDVSHMFDGNGAGDSMTQVKQLQQLVGGENAGKSVGELFQSETFGDMKQGRNLFGVSKSASFVSKTITTVVKKTVVKGAGTVIAAKVAAIGSVLAPIGIALIGTGALVKLMRMKGLKQSRAKTLNDLLQSLQPVEAGEATTVPILPDPKPNPTKEGGNGKNDKEGLYNDLLGFFKYTYNNRKIGGVESSDDVENTSDIQVGKEYFYTNKKGEKNVVKVVSLSNQYKAGDDKKFGTNDDEKLDSIEPGTAFVVFKKPNNTYGNEPARAVNKKQLSTENIMSNKDVINEGKFIKDPQVIKILEKNKGIDKNKLAFFDNFLRRVEVIRNKVNKMGNTGDNVLDKFIQKLKSNPLMTKDFVKTFSVDPNNQQNVEAMGDFINDIIEIVYKGRFRGAKIEDVAKGVTTFNKEGGAVEKMGKLGGGNINKVGVEESYLVERKGKKAKAKSTFKNHIISFITDLMGMFQYMTKLKKQGKLSSDGGKKESKPKQEPKPQQESKIFTNKVLLEEISRIKKLMK